MATPKFEIVRNGLFYEVIYRDENGVSVLDRTRYYIVAVKSMFKYEQQHEKGILLKENPRVWKYDSRLYK